MAGTTKKATGIATIDVVRVTIQSSVADSPEYVLDTASKIEVSPQTQEEKAVPLIIKGVLIAQKRATKTLTGNEIKLTDNVFAPEVVQVIQGGTVTMDTGTPTKIIGYTPPVVGSNSAALPDFVTKAYSAQYDASGKIVQYECISYPNCLGEPISLSSEDGKFRAPEYVITSAPDIGEAPYAITYLPTLPAIV